MTRSIDVSGTPTLVFQALLTSAIVLVGLFVLVIAARTFLLAFGITVPLWDGPGWLVVLLAWVPLTWLFLRRVRHGDGDWWGPIPAEQYLGRFAGHGGLARHNWEQSLRQLPGEDEEEE